MNSNNINVKYGSLTKVEDLITLKENIMSNTYVLEAHEPFPGYYSYYSNAPGNRIPLYVYYVCDKHYSLEKITKAKMNIKKYFDVDFEADFGKVNFFNKDLNVIRVRNLLDYNHIKELQTCFYDEGVSFKKMPSQDISSQGLIKLRKFFTVQEVEEGMFFDVKEPEFVYFTLPKYVKWKRFEEITKQVKNNWENKFFDAAIGHFLESDKVIEFARIYDPNMNLDLLKQAKKLYLDRL